MTPTTKSPSVEKWYFNYNILSFIDNKENVITKEKWEKYKGKYNKPTDKVLDAILYICRLSPDSTYD